MTITNENTITLHEVFYVRATLEPNVFALGVDITDMSGERYQCNYNSRPDDAFGLNPTIRQWLTDNEGSYLILPYVPPTQEEIRASLPAVSARQLRLTLVRNSISLERVRGSMNRL